MHVLIKVENKGEAHTWPLGTPNRAALGSTLAVSVVSTLHWLCVSYIWCDWIIPVLGFYLGELRTEIHTKTSTQIFTVELFMVCPGCKWLSHITTEEWTNKLCSIHILHYHLAMKRNEQLLCAKISVDLTASGHTEKTTNYDSVYATF